MNPSLISPSNSNSCVPKGGRKTVQHICTERCPWHTVREKGVEGGRFSAQGEYLHKWNVHPMKGINFKIWEADGHPQNVLYSVTLLVELHQVRTQFIATD